MRFSDLCHKTVINMNDCCTLGCIRDLEFDCRTGQICAVVVPGSAKYLGCLFREDELIIPWQQIKRIGSDIVLVNPDCKP